MITNDFHIQIVTISRTQFLLFKDRLSLKIKKKKHIYLYFIATKNLRNNALVDYLDNSTCFNSIVII